MKALTIIYAVSALDLFSFAIVIPIISAHLLSLEATKFQLGILGSLGALITLIWNPLSGSLSDTNGRKLMLQVSLGICIFSNAILAYTNTLYVAYLARILCSLGSQIQGLMKTLLSDNVKSKEEQSLILNKLHATGAVCFIFGSLFGGTLSQVKNGFSYVFMIICLIQLTNFGLVNLLPKEERKTSPDKKQQNSIFSAVTTEASKAISNIRNIDWTTCKDVFTLKLCLEMSYGVWQANFGFILIEVFEATGKTLGYILAFLSITGIISNHLMVKFKNKVFSSDEEGRGRFLFGKTLLVITFTTISFVDDFYIYVACLVPMGVARTLLENTMNEVLLSRVSPENKGAVMGAFDSLMSLAGLVTPILAASITYVIGLQASTLVSVIPIFIELFV